MLLKILSNGKSNNVYVVIVKVIFTGHFGALNTTRTYLRTGACFIDPVRRSAAERSRPVQSSRGEPSFSTFSIQEANGASAPTVSRLYTSQLSPPSPLS